MTNALLVDAPFVATRPATDAVPHAPRLLIEHPRGRGFSVVRRLAQEAAPSVAPRHRLDVAESELTR